MKREKSREEAEQDLEKAVKDFDWIKEFLGDNKDDFLLTYRALHAQLRDGDKLKIEIYKGSCRDKHGSEVYEPWFEIVLHKLDGDKEDLYRVDPDGTTFPRYPPRLLYSD